MTDLSERELVARTLFGQFPMITRKASYKGADAVLLALREQRDAERKSEREWSPGLAGEAACLPYLPS